MSPYEKFVCDEALGDVDWDAGSLVHNWRNHVGDRAREIWATFTPEQKCALALDANERAGHEDWD